MAKPAPHTRFLTLPSPAAHIKTIIERQQCMPAECDDDRLFLDGQNCGPRLFRAGRKIGRRRTISPLAHGLLVDPVAIGQSPQALLTMLYRSTHRRCRGGAPVENLAHSASFHSKENNAPSKPGIKHL